MICATKTTAVCSPGTSQTARLHARNVQLADTKIPPRFPLFCFPHLVCINFRNSAVGEPAAAAGAVAQKGRTLPGPEEIVHDRFLACVEREDSNGAMAHFAFISCEGGALVTLRRRQLLVMLCEKGLVKEASELLTGATVSPSFDSQDLSTIVSAASSLVMSLACSSRLFVDVS